MGNTNDHPTLAAASAPQAAQVLDARTLSQLDELAAASRDAELFDRMMQVFFDTTQTRLRGLQGLHEVRDAAQVGEVAHAICGGAVSIGAVRLAAHCRDLQRTAAAGQLELQPQWRAELRAEIELTFAALRQLLASRL